MPLINGSPKNVTINLLFVTGSSENATIKMYLLQILPKKCSNQQLINMTINMDMYEVYEQIHVLNINMYVYNVVPGSLGSLFQKK